MGGWDDEMEKWKVEMIGDRGKERSKMRVIEERKKERIP